MTLPSTVPLKLGQGEIALRVRRSDRARRLSLRIDPSSLALELVLPRRAALAEGLRFAARQAGWIEHRLSKLPPRVVLGHGAVVPYLGEPHRLRHIPAARRHIERVLMDDGTAELVIGGGEAALLGGRLKAWMRKETQRLIAPLAHDKAARLGKRIKRLSIRDSRTRWGSCSASGALSFSWRLAMTPPAVIDYLAAHEVAHLAELNHGPRFWRCCAALAAQDIAPSRAWLRKHGEEILAVG
jgi:predicted metal-dependent hydrolase